MRRLYQFFYVSALGLVLLCCSTTPQEKWIEEISEKSRVIRSFYRPVGDTLQFSRIVETDAGLIHQTGGIFYDEFAVTTQYFTATTRLIPGDQSIDSVSAQLSSENYVTVLFPSRDVILIQLVPDSRMNVIQRYTFNQLHTHVRNQITRYLRIKKAGSMFDAVGGNIMYTIDDWETAMSGIKQILKDSDVLDHVIIARRVMTAKTYWKYEVIFPSEFEGMFQEF